MISLVGGLRRRQRISFKAAAAASGPAFRSVSTSESITTTLTVAMPAGVASGDVLVMQVAQYVDQKVGGFVTDPVGWTARQFITIDNAVRVKVYTKTAGAAESSVVFSGLAGNYVSTATVLAVSGAASVDVSGTMQPYGFVAPSVTTTTANGLLIGMWSRTASTGSGQDFGLPGSMTERSNEQSATSGYHIHTAFATETLTASGATGTRTATFAGSAYVQTATLLAVK
jgi:hypothetical protein